MKLELGKFYKCGEHKVKVVTKLPSDFGVGIRLNGSDYDYVLIADDCLATIGRFRQDGDWSLCNPNALQRRLEELVTPEKQQKLDHIAAIESELAKLKQEVEKE